MCALALAAAVAAAALMFLHRAALERAYFVMLLVEYAVARSQNTFLTAELVLYKQTQPVPSYFSRCRPFYLILSPMGTYHDCQLFWASLAATHEGHRSK